MDDAPPAQQEQDIGTEEPADGLVKVRGALGGLALLWLAAMAGFGAMQATVYGITTSPLYLLVALGAVALAVASGYGSLRAFGVK